jgi:hypothetical protein
MSRCVRLPGPAAGTSTTARPTDSTPHHASVVRARHCIGTSSVDSVCAEIGTRLSSQMCGPTLRRAPRPGGGGSSCSRAARAPGSPENCKADPGYVTGAPSHDTTIVAASLPALLTAAIPACLRATQAPPGLILVWRRPTQPGRLHAEHSRDPSDRAWPRDCTRLDFEPTERRPCHSAESGQLTLAERLVPPPLLQIQRALTNATPVAGVIGAPRISHGPKRAMYWSRPGRNTTSISDAL